MNLPIAERELRIAARSPRTYRGRLIAGCIFGAITGWMFWIASKIGNVSMIAPQTFAFIAHMALLMCMFSGSVTSDALSSEKRNGTLGLLFLTDLKGSDIVFGKLAALGLIAFYGLMGLLPILAMPVLMGGISGQSVFRTSLTLLNALLLSLSIGLWVSARSWEQKRALNGTVWIAVMLMWLLPAFTTVARLRYPALVEYVEYLELLSPMYQQSHSSPFGVALMRQKYWQSLGLTHLLAWFFLWRACAILPHKWQDRAVISAIGRWKKFLEELRYGSSAIRASLRARLLRINAVHWLSSRERFAPTNLWLLLTAVLTGWFAMWGWIQWRYGGNGPPFYGIGIPSTLILYLAMRVRSCGIAGEIIVRDRFSGALELLLSTTLTERDVARGQWLTWARTVLGPAIATAVIGTFVMICALFDVNDHEVGNLLYVYVALVILFAADLVASVWTGMWTACFSRTVSAAPGHAILRLLALPWMLFFGGITLCIWLKIGQHMEFPEVFTIWWLIVMTNNLFWTVRSRRLFYQRLRSAAAERYQPPMTKRSWWRFFGMAENTSGEIRLSKPA
jgi:ABC-type transport system involved in multi-copper enzyme maturation permease subunit